MKAKIKLIKRKVLSPNLYYGFEVEGCYPSNKRDEFHTLIHRIYGDKAKSGTDVSLLVPYGYCNTEIKTPRLKESVAFDKLFQLFEGLERLGFITNSSCGLHVNLSEKTLFSKYNHEDNRVKKLCSKFVRNFKTDYWREKFKRKKNCYCIWSNSLKERLSTPDGISDFVTSNCASRFSAINFKSLKSSSRLRRIEVRLAGNKDYHKKTNILKQYLSEISTAAKAGFRYAHS